MHMESVASSRWCNEPTLDFVTKVIILVGGYLKLSEQLFGVVWVRPRGPVNRACLIVELSTQSVRATLRHICDWRRSSKLDLAIYRRILVLGDVTGLSCNLDSDVGRRTEALPIDSQVLSTIGVTLMGRNVRDRRYHHAMEAFAHVVWAVSRFLFCHDGVTDLPQHLYVLVVTSWHITDFANDSVFIPVAETIVIIYKEFVVKLGASDLGVNEDHLIRFQISYEAQGLKGIEPKLCLRFVVDDWWVQVVY